MAKDTNRRTGRKEPLSKERVFATAIDLADAEGVAALTMRGLAKRLGVEAMSLYHHVADKEEILDGMVEAVFAEMKLPDGTDWKTAMRARCSLLRETLLRHPWSVSLLDSRRNPGPATLTHQDWVLGTLYAAGFSVPLGAHAAAMLDAYVYGFAVQEVALPFSTAEEVPEVMDDLAALMQPHAYPNLVRMAADYVMQPGYAFANEFPFGLELILDGLERARDGESGGDPASGSADRA